MTNQKKCRICRREPELTCDWRQGRCPHLPPVLQLSIIDKIKNFFSINTPKTVTKEDLEVYNEERLVSKYDKENIKGKK